MKNNVLLFLYVILFTILTLTSCTSSRSILEEENRVLKEEVKQLEQEIERFTINNSLTSDVEETIESYKTQLLFNNPMNIPLVYRITPAPIIQNGWYLITDEVSITLLNSNEVKKVIFKASFLGTEAPPEVLAVDDSIEDGWTYQGSLPGKGGKIAFWAEIEMDNGCLHQSSVLPIIVK
ncbi:MAG: hypothetical protein ACOYVD_08945 [Bacillota bacterium]